ncbi:DUF317 domain-containing protein [Streptomyces sp. NBC_00582]|uniref:DUF317 domain-containing protein n=1 Tax=Streptomyces sp. NBC_00582 TaxID=2975783 RepID=UPI002E8031F4|nr:DUF317 domain-containing protein [Streptomyces sp. NBC_00582]WUB60892.1 DUF317 domain-containing protein [Streptomyces sp. NBC_00582]
MPHPTVPYVLAAPGYLTGGGDWEHLTEWLLRGHGWRDVSTIDQHTALASPDGRLHVALSRRAAWTWSLRAATSHDQDWAALLGAHIPVEYITELVDTMLRPASRYDPDVLGPLHAAGWTTAAAAPPSTTVSPDGLVRFTAEPTPSRAPRPWHAACTVDRQTWWTAAFSTHTPPGVVAAFTRSLASNDPLLRMAIGTPLYGCGPYTRVTQTPHGYDDEQAQLEARITEARGHRLAAASPTAPPPSSRRASRTR